MGIFSFIGSFIGDYVDGAVAATLAHLLKQPFSIAENKGGLPQMVKAIREGGFSTLYQGQLAKMSHYALSIGYRAALYEMFMKILLTIRGSPNPVDKPGQFIRLSIFSGMLSGATSMLFKGFAMRNMHIIKTSSISRVTNFSDIFTKTQTKYIHPDSHLLMMLIRTSFTGFQLGLFEGVLHTFDRHNYILKKISLAFTSSFVAAVISNPFRFAQNYSNLHGTSLMQSLLGTYQSMGIYNMFTRNIFNVNYHVRSVLFLLIYSTFKSRHQYRANEVYLFG